MAAALAGEIITRTLLVADGMFLGQRPLPPFGAITNPRQRAWAEQWREHLTRGERPADIGGFSLELGWDMAAAATSADQRYRTNTLAARGPREYAPDPPADRLRVLAFGDSFTFCDEVDDTDTWQSQLEVMRPTWEAVNFGVGGYGTDQALLRYRATRQHVHGHVVAIGLMLENICRNVNRYRPLYYPQTGVAYAKPRFAFDPAGQLQLVALPFDSFASYIDRVLDGSAPALLRDHEYWTGPQPPFGESLATVRLVAAWFAYRARAPRSLWEQPDAEPFRITVAILESFHREALAHGAVAAPVLVFPAQSDLEALLSESSAYWQPLRLELERRGVPYLDLAQPLAAACRADARAAATCYVGGHLNGTANGIVARELAEWIVGHAPAELTRPRGR